MLVVSDLCKKFEEGVSKVDNVSFTVETGQLMVLLGRSGCGKTTTLKMVNRLLEPTSGTILLNGVDTSTLDKVELRRRIGYVFQNFNLVPHMTIKENLEIVPRLLGWSKERRAARVTELLQRVGMDPDDMRHRFPCELSWGNSQRIGFARALAANPELMLVDEPFGSLDILTRGEISAEFKELQRSIGVTTLMITHDVVIAIKLADVLGVMHEGKLLQVGTPRELARNPNDPFVEKLLGRAAAVWEVAHG